MSIFQFNGDIYVQTNRVAMGSPLGPILANILMTELEEELIVKVGEDLVNWKRYVDDTLAYIKIETLNDTLNKLNSFDEKIKFTYEIEVDNKISFLDVLIQHEKDGKLQTSVFRKETNTDVYINWHSHVPLQWKKSTLRSLVNRALHICSLPSSLAQEIDHLKNIFVKQNAYPSNFVNSIITDEITKFNNKNHENEVNDTILEPVTQLQLMLPYNGATGENIINKMKKQLKRYLPPETTSNIIYKSKKTFN